MKHNIRRTMAKDRPTVQQIFEHVFNSNRWGSMESISGPGSTLRGARQLLAELPQTFAALDIRTLVDAPCGDANWIRQLDYELDEYIGIDIVPDLIARLQREFANEKRRFQVGDITAEILPAADALLCRDCLVHLSLDLAMAAVRNWSQAGFRYVLATTWPGAENRDIQTGRWRPLDMEGAPFHFPPPARLIADGRHPKAIGVWQAREIFKAPRKTRRPRTVADMNPDPDEVTPDLEPRAKKPKGTRARNRARVRELEHLWKNGRKKQALALSDEFYGDAPDSGGIANFHSWSLLEAGQLNRALAVSLECFERFRAERFLDRACLIQIKLGRASDALRWTESLFGDAKLGPHALLAHGAVMLLATGQWDRSVEFFHRAAAAGDLGRDKLPAHEALFNSDFQHLTQMEELRDARPLHNVGMRATNADAVVVVGADERYFRALFDIFRDSFLAACTNPRYIVHAHIFDPSDALLEEVVASQARFDGRVCFSYERTDGTNRSYYYVGRFVQAPRFLAQYRCPIIVSDLDCYFSGSIENILSATADSDIGILELERRLFPWRNFLAGLVQFNPTPAGERFAAGMRNFLLSFPPQTDYWYIDQLAVTQCVYLSRNLGIGRVASVTEQWRATFEQATGTSGEPDAKADRLRESMLKRAQRRHMGARGSAADR